mmetsp:Transcript_83224/g.269255  ORF Transcript_83224/g.269255 Transcript_83224/m.269255 type:complete len:211 (-) Transcript_83224:477-1109(-)
MPAQARVPGAQVDHHGAPGAPDHHQRQQAVKDEPRVVKRVPQPAEGHETRYDLKAEEDAEEVLDHLEGHGRLDQHRRVVHVRVDSDPKPVQGDHGEREAPEGAAARDALPSTGLLVEDLHIVLLLAHSRPDLVLHCVRVGEEVAALHRRLAGLRRRLGKAGVGAVAKRSRWLGLPLHLGQRLPGRLRGRPQQGRGRAGSPPDLGREAASR